MTWEMGKVRFIWWSDLSDCIVKNRNHKLLSQMTQKLMEKLISEEIYCDTDVSHLTRNVAKAAMRRAYAPSVVRRERVRKTFSDKLNFSASDCPIFCRENNPQVFYMRSFLLCTSVNYLNLVGCTLLGPL